MIGIYLIISVIYAGVFAAWMNTKKYNNEYWQYGDWKTEYVFACAAGTLLWPLFIPFIFVYKLATKYFNNKKQKQ